MANFMDFTEWDSAQPTYVPPTDFIGRAQEEARQAERTRRQAKRDRRQARRDARTTAPTPTPAMRRGEEQSGQRDILAQQAADAKRAQTMYQRESAFDRAWGFLGDYGLSREEAAAAVRGLDPNQRTNQGAILEAIRSTPSYQTRFGGIQAAREQNGLNYINEGSILAQENQFREYLAPLNLNEGRMGDYIEGWVGSGASPAEIGRRVAVAEDWVNGQDKETLNWMANQYGVKKKDLVGYVLDNKGDRSTAWFEDQQKAAQLGSEAGRYGSKLRKHEAGGLVDRDVTREQARAAFKYADEMDTEADRLAALSGQGGFREKNLAMSKLPGNKKQNKKGKEVQARLANLRKNEAARWGGSTAQGAGDALGGSSTTGNF